MGKNAKNCMYVIDEEYKIVYINDRMKELYGQVKMGSTCHEVICKQHLPCSFCPIYNESEYENPYDYGENQNWDNLHYAPISLPDGKKGYTVIFSPAKKESERSEEKKKRFAQNLWMDSERYGIIAGYCEEDFPLYYANDTMIKMLGYKDYEEFKDAIRNRVANTVHPDDMVNVLNDLGDNYCLGMSYESVYRMVKKDGSCFWIRDRGKVVETEDGRMAIISVCIDLSSEIAVHDDLEKKRRQIDMIKGVMSNALEEKENQYKSAITSGATAVYEVNLSRDILRNVSGIEKNNEVKLAEIVGLKLPCGYTDYVERWSSRMSDDARENYLNFNRREHLIECYEHGKLELNVEYETVNMRGEDQYMRKTYVLMKDGVTGDICALIVSRDITYEVSEKQQKEFQIRKQLDIIKALSREYSTVYLLDWEKEELQMYSTENDMVKVHETFRGIRAYSEMVETYAKNMVHPDDMKRFLEEVRLEEVRKGLDEKRVYDVNYRRLISGKMEYAQIRFMSIKSAAARENTICAIRCIDNIIREEQRKNEVIDALSYGYSSSFIMDWDTDELELFKLMDETHIEYSEIFTKCRTYEQGMMNYLEAVASDKEIKKLRKELSAESVRERLLQKTLYSIMFERTMNRKKDHVQFRFVLVKRQDGKKIIVMSVRDMDDALEKELRQKRRLEQALLQARAATESKTTFLSNMSHDIRTPMNAVIGFADMAKKYIDNKEKVLECIDKVEMSGKHMLRIINDVLDMARIESGKMELDVSLVNVMYEMKNVDALFRTAMEEKGLKFDIRIQVQDEWLLMDGMRVNQVIINLISNAMKYTKPGGRVCVTLSQIGEREHGKASYQIRVKDTGIGMSKEYQNHLFEAFERERTATVSGVQGTGLGLAISKKIADLLGGEISCVSEIGVGTEFVFSFKAVVDKEHKHRNKSNIEHSKYIGKRVLVVEDNELNRELAVDILEGYGLKVDTAEDGSIAVEKLRNAQKNEYDLLLMDVQMPYMDGYTATQLIRSKKDEWYCNVPIVAMTANAFEEDKNRAYEAGMDGHLAKPIDRKKLMETLQQTFLGTV